MDLSIIIPTYNRQQLLKYTLDSVMPGNHEGVDYEVIVVDDNSTDRTMEMVAKDYSFVRLIKNEAKGAAAARNAGLRTAKGEYILYLDSDDIIGAGALIQKVLFLKAHPEYDACYGEYEYFNAPAELTTESIIFWNKYPDVENDKGLNQHLVNYLKGDYIPPGAIVWRKNLLQKIGGHDPSLQINQDVELFVRALLNGLKVGCVRDSSRVYIRHHDTDARVGIANSTAKRVQMLQLRKKFYEHLEETGQINEEYKKALSQYAFVEWQRQRDAKAEMADDFLHFAKSMHWPVKMEGSFGFRLLAKLFGPDGAVKIKYFLVRRNF